MSPACVADHAGNWPDVFGFAIFAALFAFVIWVFLVRGVGL